jgi:TPP-dependent pyruvate/acetoin dehydrogenase alpha subunit
MTHTHLAAARPATAAQRTELLHRMLLVRRFEERRIERGDTATIGDGADLHLGEEAIAVGVMTALGPADTVVGEFSRAVDQARTDVLDGRPSVTVCLFGGAVTGPRFTESVDIAILRQLPVLFCCANDRENASAVGSAGLPAETVDGMDVEAVVQAAWATVRPTRAGGGPRLLELQTHGGGPGDPRDPIRILADRMRNDHQLDDNALEAISLDVAAHLDAAAALLRPAGATA